MTRKLAYFHHPASHSWMFIHSTARPICEMIWMIDSRWPQSKALSRVLSRSGTVLDTAGLNATELAELLSEHDPDGILTFADSLIVLTAQVAERLKLPFSSVETAVALTDKWAQRTALAAAGVPTPGFWQVPAREDDAGQKLFWSSVRFPSVLKPRRSQASRDTVKVLSTAELREELDALEQARGGSEALIVEEYIPDRPMDLGQTFAGYVSVESIASEGEIQHLTVTGRLPLAPPLRETGYFIPSALSGAEVAEVIALADAAVRALGITSGCCHTEVKLTPDGPRVIEVNGRIGGGISEMIQDVSGGYEMLREAMKVALGDPLQAGPTMFSAIAYLIYIQAPPGMREVTSVTGMQTLRDLPDVSEVILNRGPGSHVDWREGNHGNVCSIRGTVPTVADLVSLVERLPSLVSVDGV